MSKYFSAAEFRRCTQSCSIEQMADRFLSIMDEVRERAGIPLVVTSAYRSREWEREHKRTGNSAHPRGVAMDIRCNTSNNRWRISRAALAVGIRRIGIGKNYLHLDCDDSLPQNVIWHYYD